MSRTVLALIMVGGVILAASMYVLSCWLWPFAACSVCDGTGRWSREDGKVWRPCRWCRGNGRRLRVGRWIYNRASRARRESR